MNNTGIEYVDHSWNPWIGCRKVSEGCRNCYMHREMDRYGQDPSDIHRTAAGTWKQVKKFEPGAWVFVCSWSDFFLSEADPWRDDAWKVMESRPDVVWVLVTKRPENIAGRLPWGSGTPWPNIIGVVTTENQEMADLRIPILLRSNFAIRGISIGPMLGPVNIRKYFMHSIRCPDMPMANEPMSWAGSSDRCECPHLNWVIVEGESGPGARPMHPDWAMSVRDQCVEAGVPFFFKQWGEFGPWDHRRGTDDVPRVISVPFRPGCPDRYPLGWVRRVGKKSAGRLLDGREWNEVPR